MFRRVFLTAILAGAIAGFALSALQQVSTVPLILKAETYEEAPVSSHGHRQDAAAGKTVEDAGGLTLSRISFTVLFNVILAVGFALLLTAAIAARGAEVDGRTGVLWGVGGFAVFTLAPAFGLPPELPGSAAAELELRQVWWLAAAVAAAAGIALACFAQTWPARLAGLAIVALPHLVGAPHPEGYVSSVPAEIQGQFVAATIVVSALFWALLGWLTGTLFRRFESA